MGMGSTLLYSQQSSKQDDVTILGEPAPVTDNMNGKVQKVVFKFFWGTGTGENIKKGNPITTLERDSLGWFYDFEAMFDKIGDHIITYNTLDDEGNPVDKYQFIREKGKIVKSKWLMGKDNKMGILGYSKGDDGYTKFYYDKNGFEVSREDYSNVGDKLLYKFPFKINEHGEKIEGKALDGQGNLLFSWTTEYNGKHQETGGKNFDKDGKLTGSYKILYNDNEKISEFTRYDKDNKVRRIGRYTYLEYDSKGNWIKCGLEYGPYTTYAERTITYF
ncbi:MAG: hypothetical protein JXC31_06660 [Acholeplasmataceae bacterium]|nr:hypothetical protein [Acholeplasmataceae bacterium]